MIEFEMGMPLEMAGNHCIVHGYHWPEPVRTVWHHIEPLEYGGKTVKTNLVAVCDTGHYNIHAYLDALIDGKVVPKVTREEKRLALLGYTQIRETLFEH